MSVRASVKTCCQILVYPGEVIAQREVSLHHLFLCPFGPSAFLVSSIISRKSTSALSWSNDPGIGSLTANTAAGDGGDCDGGSHCANPTTASAAVPSSGTSTTTNVGLPSRIPLMFLVARHCASSRLGSPVSDLW